ncbi:MAG: hypothetical protein IJ067_08350 [Prevotella sp.]|nr:hypothetical protein [Prevotella sp.]
MATIYSNALKAALFLGNLEDGKLNVTKDLCFTVQHFDYRVERNRDKAGMPYGQHLTTILNYTVKLTAPEDSRVYYRLLTEDHPQAYSFLFNATYSQVGRLSAFDDALVVMGHVVDVEDNYDSAPEGDLSEQMLIHVKLLVTKIVYKGRDFDRVLEINRVH